MIPSQTPRTDALLAPGTGSETIGHDEWYALCNHARTLERELAAANARLEVNATPYDGIATRDETIRMLERELAEARENESTLAGQIADVTARNAELELSISEVQERARRAEETNAVLRRDLLDPPVDVQELVIKKLGLVSGKYAEALAGALGSLQEMLAKQIVGTETGAVCAACGECSKYGEPEHEASCPVDRGLKIIEAVLAKNSSQEFS